jgi:hypothetical protein
MKVPSSSETLWAPEDEHDFLLAQTYPYESAVLGKLLNDK